MIGNMRNQKLMSQADAAASLLSAMANTKRLMILCHLAEGEMNVCALAAAVGLSQSAFSQHLVKLRNGRLVKPRCVAQTELYSIDCRSAAAVLETLNTICIDGDSTE